MKPRQRQKKAVITSDSADTNTFIDDKVLAFYDHHCNVITPFIAVPGHRHELPLLLLALPRVSRIAKHVGLDLYINYHQP